VATLLIRTWPDALHRELKKAAIDRGVTLKEIMLEAAQAWLKAKKKQAGRRPVLSKTRRP
jgi:hypothetical protein